MALANGQLPASLLAPCDGTPGAVLRVGAAASWNAVRAEVHARFGWWPTITSAGDAYRSLPRQVTLFQRHYTTSPTGVDRRVWDGRTWWRRPGFPSAATPGRSNHGMGTTVDVTGLGAFDSLRHRQFSQVAKAHGWSDSEGRSISEPWHWNRFASPDAVSNPVGDVGSIPTVPGIDPPQSLTPKGFTVDAEAAARFDDTRDWLKKILDTVTAGDQNLAQYGHNLTVLGQEIKAAVQVATDNAYTGAQISTRVLNAVADPDRGLAVMLARLSAEVAALRATGGDTTGVDVQAIADAAAREAIRDLTHALADATEKSAP